MDQPMPPDAGGRSTLPLWAHLAPLALGLILFPVAFIWFDPLWPAQDMPPAVALRYRQAVERSGEVYALARWITGGGLAWFVGVLLWRRWRAGRPPR